MYFTKKSYLANKWKIPSKNLWGQIIGAESYFGHSVGVTGLLWNEKNIFVEKIFNFILIIFIGGMGDFGFETIMHISMRGQKW